MELSAQLIENINNLSNNDKELLMDLIERMNKKTEHSDAPAFEEKDFIIKALKAINFPISNNLLKEEDLTIVAEFCEALGIEADEVKLLFNISVSILTQNIKLYWELTTKNNSCINLTIANDYMVIDKTKTEEMYKKASDSFRMFKFEEALPLLQQLAVLGYPESYALLYWVYCDSDRYKDGNLQQNCLKRGYELGDSITTVSVSYTHLTLPTNSLV